MNWNTHTLHGQDLLKWGLHLKERIHFKAAISSPVGKGGKNDRVVAHGSVPIHLGFPIVLNLLNLLSYNLVLVTFYSYIHTVFLRL